MNEIFKKNYMQCWYDKISMCFSTYSSWWLFLWMISELLVIVNVYSVLLWLSFYFTEMLCHMIRNDEMKLCDQNMLECDDEISLITHDEYNQSNISEWWRWWDFTRINDEQQWEWEQMMMIITRICYNKRWQEWCMIDEDYTTDNNIWQMRWDNRWEFCKANVWHSEYVAKLQFNYSAKSRHVSLIQKSL